VDRSELRATVRNLYDIQKMRIAMGNRAGIKKNGEEQKSKGMMDKTEKAQLHYDIGYMNLVEAEQEMLKGLKKTVEQTEIWRTFLKDVKGCGTLMAAVLISEIDVTKANTVSAVWQFAGLNSGMVFGRKKDGDSVVVTEELIRGDKMKSGYLAPYNPFLKTKLLGVLASCFIKSRSEYSKIYYDYKERLKNSRKQVGGSGKRWCDETDVHRHKAAMRYMMKEFLADYFTNYRKLLGLEVRPRYCEQYLGITHHKENAT
jgi:hypothetical protein